MITVTRLASVDLRSEARFPCSDSRSPDKKMEVKIDRILNSMKLAQDSSALFQEEVPKESQTVRRLMGLIPELQAIVNALQQDIGGLRSELNQLKNHTNMQEQQDESKNNIFYQPPGRSGENLDTSEAPISKVLSKVGIRIKLVVAHRLS